MDIGLRNIRHIGIKSHKIILVKLLESVEIEGFQPGAQLVIELQGSIQGDILKTAAALSFEIDRSGIPPPALLASE